MKQGEAIEAGRQISEVNMILPNLDAFGVSLVAPVVSIKNSTSFNITEVVVVVGDRKTNKTNEYVINNFDDASQGFYSKMPEPASRKSS